MPTSAPKKLPYTPVSLERYEMKWGSYNPHYLRNAISMVRRLIMFSDITFRYCERTRCSLGEERVLDQLEMCLSCWEPIPWTPAQCPRVAPDCTIELPTIGETQWDASAETRATAREMDSMIEYTAPLGDYD